MKKIVAFTLSLAAFFGAYLAWQAIQFVSAPAQNVKNEVLIEIQNGAAFYSVAKNLEQNGVVSSAQKFGWYAKILNKTKQVKVGEYRLFTDMNPNQVLAVITSGQSIAYTLTIPEGFNIYEIRVQLNAMWKGKGDAFFKLATDPIFIKNLTGENFRSLEGYLYPETYILTKYTSMESLIRRMYDYFQKNIAEVNSVKKINMTIHDQVILASVIEKETGAVGERQLISSVFHNRLNIKMRLQSDPTIIYGMLVETNELKKNITKADILRPTPYNTYTVKSLPVGPIANPGRDALWAAVTPVDSKYLYFVSKNDGTHVFSETYKEHDNAVKKFQLDRKMRQGKSWRDLKKKQKK